MIARPRLRAIESVLVPHPRYGRALMLRDTEGVTSYVGIVPPELFPILARMDGSKTAAEIAEQVVRETGRNCHVRVVLDLARQLDEALFLDSPRYREERTRVAHSFRDAPVRPASHAGGAYPADPSELRSFLEGECIAKGAEGSGASATVALVAPHIDPWRGAVGYGHAYRHLRAHLHPDAETFVLLGTSHAPMRHPFAVCRKSFDTPLGPLDPQLEMVDTLERRAGFDIYADSFNHKREHSLEFQAVFLKHLLGNRPARIVPILCGLGPSQSSGVSPERDNDCERFITALKELCVVAAARVVVVAGADLAHVGPRFGDASPYDDQRRHRLAQTDEESLGHALRADHRAFFEHVQRDLAVRRVCGLGPVYTLTRLLPDGVRGRLLHYEQTVDPGDGSIVSHAAAAFSATP